MIYNRALSGGEIMYLAGYLPDVTAPGDIVQGVPNDGIDGPYTLIASGEIVDFAERGRSVASLHEE